MKSSIVQIQRLLKKNVLADLDVFAAEMYSVSFDFLNLSLRGRGRERERVYCSHCSSDERDQALPLPFDVRGGSPNLLHPAEGHTATVLGDGEGLPA